MVDKIGLIKTIREETSNSDTSQKVEIYKTLREEVDSSNDTSEIVNFVQTIRYAKQSELDEAEKIADNVLDSVKKYYQGK